MLLYFLAIFMKWIYMCLFFFFVVVFVICCCYRKFFSHLLCSLLRMHLCVDQMSLFTRNLLGVGNVFKGKKMPTIRQLSHNMTFEKKYDLNGFPLSLYLTLADQLDAIPSFTLANATFKHSIK